MAEEDPLLKIRDDLNKIIATFTKELSACFRKGLVKALRKKALLTQQRDWQLHAYNPDVSKEGFVRLRVNGRFKQVFLKIQDNFVCKYYESPERECLGDINFCGFELREGDASGTFVLQRIRQELPIKVKADESRTWQQVLEICCRNASYYARSSDKAWCTAFQRAFNSTRVKCHIHGPGRYTPGAEYAALESLFWDAIRSEVERMAGGEVDRLLSSEAEVTGCAACFSCFSGLMPDKKAGIRAKVDDIVQVAVRHALDQSRWSVSDIRRELEATSHSLTSHLVTSEKQMRESVRDAVADVLNPAIGKLITPAVRKPVDALIEPLFTAFMAMLEEYTALAGVFARRVGQMGRDQSSRVFRKMYWDIQSVTPITTALGDMIKHQVQYAHAAGSIVDDERAQAFVNGILGEIHRHMSALLTDAMHTLRIRLAELLAEPAATGPRELWDALPQAVVETATKLLTDTQLRFEVDLNGILKRLLLPQLKKHVLKATQAVLEPLNMLVPPALTDYILPRKTLKDMIKIAVQRETVAVAAGRVHECQQKLAMGLHAVLEAAVQQGRATRFQDSSEHAHLHPSYV
eukprot:TRINITY_DN11577_c0_g1_i1.p1 TRINITY_DN11577_c0_g1~~TRINITY_DN11577_c0_g1_i1.p1  ORF type:complete len:592 (+),score=114.74 TRINITY_DN11577_c0_g1_i1:47-1777(+)